MPKFHVRVTSTPEWLDCEIEAPTVWRAMSEVLHGSDYRFNIRQVASPQADGWFRYTWTDGTTIEAREV